MIEKSTDLSIDGSTLLGGYKVLGYNTIKPFFKFYFPVKTIRANKVSVAGVVVEQYSSYREALQTIPYGHVFDTLQDVTDFLFGYGQYLEKQGFKFD